MLPPFILKAGRGTMPVSIAEFSGRSLSSSSMGFTGLIAQREHQTMACCSNSFPWVRAQFCVESREVP